jgi:hypothetical protein
MYFNKNVYFEILCLKIKTPKIDLTIVIGFFLIKVSILAIPKITNEYHRIYTETT